MASSRKSKSADLTAVVAAALRPRISQGANLLLGLSGGIDSLVLLDLLVRLAPEMRFSLQVLHVNHGISPNAGNWAAFCMERCRELGVPFSTETVDIGPYRALGIEGAARQARFEAFARMPTDFIVLAQHRDDQVETVLLNLARGAGVRGLSGMPVSRSVNDSGATLLRPLLGASRQSIEAYARERGLQWVVDESNANLMLRRNFIRERIVPDFESVFPAFRDSVVLGAANLAEAGVLLDQLADLDLAVAVRADALHVRTLGELGEARSRNALRRWCELRGAPWPGSPRLTEVLRQARVARDDAVMAVSCREWTFRRYRGLLYLDRQPGLAGADFSEPWNAEPAVPLMALGGVLRCKPELGRGLSAARLRLQRASLQLRLRRGGERLRVGAARPHRSLKNLFQESGIPPWRRDRVPLIYCGGELVCVPGLGESSDWQAGEGEPGVIASWEPFR
ncbi:MAG: tRNA lysidine(34) synthetase TilS [Betaproteobacteria bacterium]|nr:tRNA lysidine(34) synthetase TilS [Betaproteobacteria bacterium]